MGWKTNLLTLQPFMQKTMQKTVSREGHGEWHPLTHPCTMSQSDSINTAMLLIQEKTKIFDWNKREKKKERNELRTFNNEYLASLGSKTTDLEQIFNFPRCCLKKREKGREEVYKQGRRKWVI